MKDYKFKIYGHRTERIVTREGNTNTSIMADLIYEIRQNDGWYWDIKTDTYLQVVHIKEIHE